MTISNGIGRERKVYSARLTGSINNPEVFALLQKLGTEKATINFSRKSVLESGQARLNLLMSRICSILGIDTQRFTEELLIKRFREWSIPNLDKERDPDFIDYSVRHLLEQVFDCALAYKTGAGLTIISNEERALITQDKLPGFQLISPNLPPPVSSAFLLVSTAPGCERALVRFVPNQITERKTAYPEQLRQRILFYLKEGHLRNAALLLFREQKVKDVIAFIRKEKVAEVIKADALRSALTLSISKKDSTTVEEMILGLLLRQVHPIVSAHFIADLAKIKFGSTVKVLGIVGQVSHAVEVLEVGDLRAVENLSLAGFVLSTMLMQGNEKIANLLVARGIETAHELSHRIWDHKLRAIALASISARSGAVALFDVALNEIEIFYKKRTQVIEKEWKWKWNRPRLDHSDSTEKSYLRGTYLTEYGDSGLVELIETIAVASIGNDKKIELLDLAWDRISNFQMSEEEKFEIRSKLIAVYSKAGVSSEKINWLIDWAMHMLTTDSAMWVRKNKGEIYPSELLAALKSFVEMIAEINVEGEKKVECFKWAMGFDGIINNADEYISKLLRIAELMVKANLNKEQISDLYQSLKWSVVELDEHIKNGCPSNPLWPGTGPRTLSINSYSGGEHYMILGLSKIMVSIAKAGLATDTIMKEINNCLEELKAEDHYLQCTALKILAVTMSEIGNFEKAINLAAKIKEQKAKSEALIGILGNLQDAEIEEKKKNEYFAAIEKLAFKIEGDKIDERDKALRAVVITMTRLNFIALDLVENEIKDAKEKSAAYADIAIGFARDRQFERAKYAFQQIRIKDQEELNRAFIEIQAALVRAGYIDEASIATMMETTSEMQARDCPRLAALIHKYTNPQSEGLSEEEKLRAWAHTRIYAILGMAGDR